MSSSVTEIAVPAATNVAVTDDNRRQGVRHFAQLLDDRGDGAVRQRRREKIMAIALGPAHGDEYATGCDVPAVIGNGARGYGQRPAPLGNELRRLERQRDVRERKRRHVFRNREINAPGRRQARPRPPPGPWLPRRRAPTAHGIRRDATNARRRAAPCRERRALGAPTH